MGQISYGETGMTNLAKFRLRALTKISEHWGDDPGQFLVQLHGEVSQEGSAGGEAFHVTVASPSQLSRDLVAADGIELGRGYLFMIDYDEKQISFRLQQLIDSSSATSWEGLVAFVAKYFDWIE
jgi:hypothetical protein